MTSSDLITWRAHLDLNKAAAAGALGCSRSALDSWESGRTAVPKYIGLACAALALGITAYPDQPPINK